MKYIRFLTLFFTVLTIGGCITQFIPETDEDQDLLVVEGLITDQQEVNTIKLSRSLPLGLKNTAKPVKGAIVTIIDDSGISYTLTEKVTGTYVTDPAKFRGVVGKKYRLKVFLNNKSIYNYTYESLPMELRPVPPIDSVYYEKVVLRKQENNFSAIDGCQIYVETHDPSSVTKFYRWDFNETWEFRLPFSKPVNNRCWISQNSTIINVKSTAILAEDKIKRYPLHFIANETDRLKLRYSILVNQYSVTEDEFEYWQKLQNITEEVGSLYDITPAAVPSNVYCVDNPAEKVLGYFSVSSKSSKRIFIKDYFAGVINLYTDCVSDTLYGNQPIPGLNSSVWILENYEAPNYNPPYKVLTATRGCADCTTRGVITEPAFWRESK
ncbi:MAG: DUF4249 domain-containing protein [Bacteroidales bacterium]|nr:DUF4249 domain-containing protein [Bacteroidales bacterium]